MTSWPRPLPVWITEFGFSSNRLDNSGGPSEPAKAHDLSAEYALVAQRVAGPILWYTARDYPLTAAQWLQQCPGRSCRGGVGGFGLFDWRDGALIVEPAAAAFAALAPSASAPGSRTR